MRKLDTSLLANVLYSRRKELNITQKELSELTGINRALISRIESQGFIPSVDQLLTLSEVLKFNVSEVIVDDLNRNDNNRIVNNITNSYK